MSVYYCFIYSMVFNTVNVHFIENYTNIIGSITFENIDFEKNNIFLLYFIFIIF